jgi:EAL domain-containing protein (putative c-di-GMP-specific phosphodiesterase class I)
MAADAEKSSLYSLIASASRAAPGTGMVQRSLEAIRAHLGMDVAYVSEFVDDRAVFRHVDAPGLEDVIKVGDSQSLDDIYCRHILAGRLPQLIADTATEPVAMALPMTRAIPVGKHVSVPIRMPDGRVHGMFCCLGFKADHSLQERDLQMLKVFADLAAFEIGRELETTSAANDKKERVRKAIEDGQLAIVYQPIWKVGNNRPVGFECLSRFAAEPQRPPDQWFNEAAEAGLGTALEVTAIRLALSALGSFPADIFLTVNASPQTILTRELHDALDGLPEERIVLEITEHAHIEDYDCLLRALEPLRARGVRLAVDDAGAGYAGLQHILQIRPDLIKLDIGLTRSIDLDPARRALASALTLFAREVGCRIIAEGVETASELAALRAIGIAKVQGYFLGRPTPLADALKLIEPQSATAKRVA